MSARATRTGIRKEGITGEVFPTSDHPPRDELMEGKHWRSLVIKEINISHGCGTQVLPHQAIIYLDPRQWASGPRQWAGGPRQ